MNYPKERYSRQILFGPLGEEGQKRLLQSRVAIIGLGALGTVSAGTLARAGVGFIRLIDRDYVEETNLQRQTLYTEEDSLHTRPKAEAALRRLKEINSGLFYEARVTDVNYTNVEDLIGDVDLIIDGTDNFEVRYLMNEAAIKHHKPWIYGACVASYGMTFTIIPDEGPCLACFISELPAGPVETCDTAGVIGPIAQMIASIQAGEAMKLLSGRMADLNRRVQFFDLWLNRYHNFELTRRPDCPVCSLREFPLLAGIGQKRLTQLCGRDLVQVLPVEQVNLSLDELAARLSRLGEVKNNGSLLRFAIHPYELVIFTDGRTLIKGTSDMNLAHSLYTRYLGV